MVQPKCKTTISAATPNKHSRKMDKHNAATKGAHKSHILKINRQHLLSEHQKKIRLQLDQSLDENENSRLK